MTFTHINKISLNYTLSKEIPYELRADMIFESKFWVSFFWFLPSWVTSYNYF